MSKGRERRTKPAPGTPFFVTMQGPGRPIRRDAHRLLWPAICFLTVVLKHLPARSESMVSAGATASGDNQRFRWQEAQANWTHEGEQSGERLVVRGHHYALEEPFAGIHPFDGKEAAVEAGAHVLAGLWWVEGSAGFQGEADRHDAVGGLVIARAIPAGESTFTPRLTVTRGPVSLAPVPLSLAMFSERAEAILAWRSDHWVAEGGYRVDVWEATSAPGRVQNDALDAIPQNRIQFLQGYLLTQGPGWFDWGLVAKAVWALHGTMQPTQVSPTYEYTWYPAYAPPFSWESDLVVRLHSSPERALGASAQLQLPTVSRETREWGAVRVSSWGTAPFQAKAAVRWSFLPATAVQVTGSFFAKPWERWSPASVGTYLQGSVGLGLEQKI